MKKKILALGLVAAMAAFTMAGCGSSTPTAAPSGDSSVAKASESDTDTVAIAAVVIARNDLPEDEVYDFVSTIFENSEAITSQHAKGAELDLDFASSITDVPYHPGAAKYFEEKGKTVASVAENAGKGDKVDLTFSTGGEAGTYYAFGGVLASYLTANTDLTVTAVTSDGSKANIEDLVNGDVQLGFAQSDVMSYAYQGSRLFENPVKDFSVVAALYMEQVQIVTTNPEIKTVADLKDKKVSIGAAGSGVYFNAIDILEAYGLSEDSISPVYQSFGDSADSLKDGKIDAAFIVAGAPTTAITDLGTSADVFLVSLDQEHIDKLTAASPYYSANTIPAGTY